VVLPKRIKPHVVSFRSSDRVNCRGLLLSMEIREYIQINDYFTFPLSDRFASRK
jgi:hypothetical protein